MTAVKSEDGAAQENSASKASQQLRVLVVAQHVSLPVCAAHADHALMRMATAGTSSAGAVFLFGRRRGCLWHQMVWLCHGPSRVGTKGSARGGLQHHSFRCAPQESTCQQLQHCMQHGAEKLLQKLFNDYLLLRLDTRNRAGSRGKGKSGAANGPAANLPVRPHPSNEQRAASCHPHFHAIEERQCSDAASCCDSASQPTSGVHACS